MRAFLARVLAILPAPVQAFALRVYRASVWHPSAIPPEEWTYRHLKRVWLPFYDVCIVAAAYAGIRYGVPAVEKFYPESLIHPVAYAVGVAGVACFVGVAFPRLWAVEAAAKTGFIGILTAYVLALMFLTGGGDNNRGFVVVIAVMAMIPPGIRLTTLRQERLKRAAVEEILAARAEEGTTT